MDLNSFGGEVDEPNLGDLRPRIQWQLDLNTVLYGGVGDLDREQYVVGAGVLAGIEIFVGFQQRNVRFWLGAVVETSYPSLPSLQLLPR